MTEGGIEKERREREKVVGSCRICFPPFLPPSHSLTTLCLHCPAPYSYVGKEGGRERQRDGQDRAANGRKGNGQYKQGGSLWLEEGNRRVTVGTKQSHIIRAG